ncbi:LysR family transcriptional regulator [Microvirga antarctica]|uniref:LysR family transcriptional regulator n=1 Tax=Microvirga antarctica TaxID=2819233 RepID=UPI001FE719B5|nr:LysR family transcriptional regulator [Microvirga antarctica]
MERDDETFRTVARLAPSELAAFDAVMRHGGFRAAARATGASPSALSHAVAALERRLATQLVLRSTRHVSLTEAGRRFLDALRPALDQLSAAVAELASSDAEPTGLIRINASVVAVEQVMEALLIPFMQSAPGVRVDIHGEGALVDIAEGGFDCGIRLAELVPDDCVAIPIGAATQQHIVIGSPTYLEHAPHLVSPSDLTAHQCIQLRLAPDALYRWEFAKDGESFTVRTVGRLVVGSTKLALAAAVGGLGLAYVTRALAEEALHSARVVQVLGSWTPPYPGLALYYSRHRHMSSAMQALVSYLRRERTSA